MAFSCSEAERSRGGGRRVRGGGLGAAAGTVGPRGRPRRRGAAGTTSAAIGATSVVSEGMAQTATECWFILILEPGDVWKPIFQTPKNIFWAVGSLSLQNPFFSPRIVPTPAQITIPPLSSYPALSSHPFSALLISSRSSQMLLHMYLSILRTQFKIHLKMCFQKHCVFLLLNFSKWPLKTY